MLVILCFDAVILKLIIRLPCRIVSHVDLATHTVAAFLSTPLRPPRFLDCFGSLQTEMLS